MIREVRREEYHRLGQLMVEVYAGLEGFPTPEEQPAYYRMLADIGRLTEQQDTEVLVALSPEGDLLGGVVYYGDMARYGAGGTASQESNASGIRLLGVDPKSRGAGVGRALTEACVERTGERGHPAHHPGDASGVALVPEDRLRPVARPGFRSGGAAGVRVPAAARLIASLRHR